MQSPYIITKNAPHSFFSESTKSILKKDHIRPLHTWMNTFALKTFKCTISTAFYITVIYIPPYLYSHLICSGINTSLQRIFLLRTKNYLLPYFGYFIYLYTVQFGNLFLKYQNYVNIHISILLKYTSAFYFCQFNFNFNMWLLKFKSIYFYQRVLEFFE